MKIFTLLYLLINTHISYMIINHDLQYNHTKTKDQDDLYPLNCVSTISTITLSGKYINCEFNLYNVGKYLKIDDDIIGIKYYFCNESILKGIYQTCNIKKTKKKVKQVNKTLFYNQISIIIKYDKDQINLKLFKNGSIQITGCKNVKNIDHYLNILYKKLLNFQNKNVNILLTKDSNNTFLDCHNYIYDNDSKVIGYYDNDKNKYNIMKTPSKTNNKSKLYTIIEYDTSPFITYNKECTYEIDIDCINICININTKLNLYKLYQYLINNQYICKYNPETYTGIKFIYKSMISYNDKDKDMGICNCNNKCICMNVTFLIFQTGNIICAGLKSFEQIEKIIPNFLSIITKYYLHN